MESATSNVASVASSPPFVNGFEVGSIDRNSQTCLVGRPLVKLRRVSFSTLRLCAAVGGVNYQSARNELCTRRCRSIPQLFDHRGRDTRRQAGGRIRVTYMLMIFADEADWTTKSEAEMAPIMEAHQQLENDLRKAG